jgi:hypothetical protein
MHSDQAPSYIGALVVVAIVIATAAWGSAYAAMLLTLWKGMTQ